MTFYVVQQGLEIQGFWFQKKNVQLKMYETQCKSERTLVGIAHQRAYIHKMTLLLPHTATTRLEAISQWQKMPFLCKPPTAFQSLRKNSGNANTHFSLMIRLLFLQKTGGDLFESKITDNYFYPKCSLMTIIG